MIEGPHHEHELHSGLLMLTRMSAHEYDDQLRYEIQRVN